MAPGNCPFNAAALILSVMICHGTPLQCGREQSTLGMMLRQHVFKKIKGLSLGIDCLQACNEDFRCQSFNYVIPQRACELNNRTKEARPEDFVPDSDRYYFKRKVNRVPLGSIPELPAEMCKEIKASEGGHAVSGKYWFDSIVPGKVVLADCDMETEDLDECSANAQVCDLNAKCINTRGSHHCLCHAGFTGDGKKCTEINCFDYPVGVSSPAMLPDNQMTASSYFATGYRVYNGRLHDTRGDGWCSAVPDSNNDWLQIDFARIIQVCAVATQGDVNGNEWVTDFKLSYSSDGHSWETYKDANGADQVFHREGNSNTIDQHKLLTPVPARYIRFHPTNRNNWNCLRVEVYSDSPPECQDYQNLTGSHRQTTHVTVDDASKHCDQSLGPAWFRFQGDAGTQMPTSCVSENHCGTSAAGWLNDAHPTIAEGQKSKQVCFTWLSNCCRYSINIQVRNCGSYYVYFISGTPPSNPCYLGYCGTD